MVDLVRGFSFLLICCLTNFAASKPPLSGKQGFLLRRQRSAATQQCQRERPSPLDYVYGYQSPRCACRSDSSCGNVLSTPLGSDGNICSDGEVGTKARVTVNLRVTACCDGQEGATGEQGRANVTLEVWQTNGEGTYTQRSKCYKRLVTNSDGRVNFSAPVPGPLSLGTDGHSSVPGYQHGPVNVLAHKFTDDEVRFHSKAVRLFYQSVDNSNAFDTDKALSCSGPKGRPFNITHTEEGSVCNYTLKMDCEVPDALDYAPDHFIRRREKHLRRGFMHDEPPRPRPNINGCPRLSMLRHAYESASLVMAVEICDPFKFYQDGPCNQTDLRTYVSLRQSMYLAKPVRVFKDLNDGDVQIDGVQGDARHRLLARFKNQDLTKWAVLVDHHLEIDCCNELEFGQQYMVMGVPLPTVPAENTQFKVMRLWTERVNHVLDSLRHLLEMN